MHLKIANIEYRTPQEVLDICNAKLQAWLEASPAMNCKKWNETYWAAIGSPKPLSKNNKDGYTHHGKLVCIEEIE